jgi:neutral ceramidase
VNNINFRTKGERLPPYAKMREVANLVAQKVFEAHQKIEFHDQVKLAARQRELTLAVRKPTPDELQYAREVLAKPADAKPYHVREQNYAHRVLQLEKSPESVSVILQAFRIGEVGIATMPFEVFAEIGLEIKQKGPLPRTFTISLANGSYGYLPSPRHFALGGYETWLGSNNVEPEAAPKMVAALMAMFDEIK